MTECIALLREGCLFVVCCRRPRQQAFSNIRAPRRRYRHHAQLGDCPQIACRVQYVCVEGAFGAEPSRDAGRRLPAAGSIATPYNAPVAQLDRVGVSEEVE